MMLVIYEHHKPVLITIYWLYLMVLLFIISYEPDKLKLVLALSESLNKHGQIQIKKKVGSVKTFPDRFACFLKWSICFCCRE